jgi:hypothetical protein
MPVILSGYNGNNLIPSLLLTYVLFLDPNATAKWETLLLLIRETPGQISARRPATVTKVV